MLGYDAAYGCANGVTPTGDPTGGPAGSVTIAARQATILGTLTANGGAGADALTACGTAGGNAGSGGEVTLTAAGITLSHPVLADGGAGGKGAKADSYSVALSSGKSAPGVIVVLETTPTNIALLHGQAAAAGSPPGQVTLIALTAQQQAALPSAPPPLVTMLGRNTIRQPLQDPAPFGHGMACGKGDLDVGPGKPVSLVGIQVFTHVCLHSGGSILVPGRLTLLALTISVDAASGIYAVGVIAPTKASTTNGTYPFSTTLGLREAPHVGVPGAAGSGGDYIVGYEDPGPALPTRGYGGGAITLAATHADLDIMPTSQTYWR